ncbi:unnamed protein product [Chondrus crispus]|uniref:Uncharacterized protein n=1 Tax=Chondrus crispus TaxID=2769 RepID=R7QNJ8_CHOCR|nr:unnamed protein product [Chondrus crispus]CDF39036.1 unnamed protein product [Chondrus crispus]|eukprot:XP_005718941.1 unnamed protein product [Chondrus crispus]
MRVRRTLHGFGAFDHPTTGNLELLGHRLIRLQRHTPCRLCSPQALIKSSVDSSCEQNRSSEACGT